MLSQESLRAVVHENGYRAIAAMSFSGIAYLTKRAQTYTNAGYILRRLLDGSVFLATKGKRE